MAFADGLLDDAQSRAIEQRLAVDEALRQRLHPFLVTGRPLARFFERSMTAELPDRLLDAVLGAPSAAPAAAPKSSAPARPAGGSLHWLFGAAPLRLAGAMGSALAVGILAGWIVRGDEPEAPGARSASLMLETSRGLLARGDLRQALDASPAGTTHLGATVKVRPQLTFVTADGTVCRQYRLDVSETQGFGGIACRLGSDWRIDVHTPAAAMQAPAVGFRTADGPNNPPAVEGAVDKLMAADRLTDQQEQDLIRKGWNTGR
ncbi:MAG: hypothetical protein ACOYLQ_11715 [Hyphomicrobiaceae bacterium]